MIIYAPQQIIISKAIDPTTAPDIKTGACANIVIIVITPKTSRAIATATLSFLGPELGLISDSLEPLDNPNVSFEFTVLD